MPILNSPRRRGFANIILHGDLVYSLGLDANKEGIARFVRKGVPLDALDNKVDKSLHIVVKGFRPQLRLDLIEMGANPFI